MKETNTYRLPHSLKQAEERLSREDGTSINQFVLPSDPLAATRTARAYAEMGGISAGDIVLVEVGKDQRSITVEVSS